MAINLWEAGGQPTSYDVVPPTSANFATIPLSKNYVLTFKAKSPSGARLRVSSSQATADLSIFETLTPEFKEYRYEWFEAEGGRIFFYDIDVKGDIAAKDIKLIEKPLGRSTINGIDGFLSGKWTLHANAKAIDDETFELNAVGAFNQSFIDLQTNPLTTYTVIVQSDNPIGRMYVEERNSSNAGIGFLGGAVSGIFTRTFTTTNNVGGKTRIYVDNNGNTTGKFTFKRPMLNLGTIPAPYEPKRGERMVMPITVKNFIPDQDLNAPVWQQDAAATKTKQSDGSLLIGNTTYNNGIWTLGSKLGLTSTSGFLPVTFSCEVRADSAQRATLEVGNTSYYDVTTEWTKISKTSLAFNILGGISIKAGDITKTGSMYVRNIQLEEGETATPFEPYRVQTSRKATRTTPINGVPGKNLIDESLLAKDSDVNISTGLQTTGSRTVSTNFIPVKPNMPYIFKRPVGSGNIGFRAYGMDKGYLSTITLSATLLTATFTTSSNVYFVKFIDEANTLTKGYQLEEGSTATPYEPYKAGPRPANLPVRQAFR